MSTEKIRHEARLLAETLRAIIRYKAGGFFHDPLCPFEIQGMRNGIKFRILIGEEGGLVTFKNFVLPCPFDLSFWGPQPLLNLVQDITVDLGSSIPIFTNLGNPDARCIHSTLQVWEKWLDFAIQLRQLTKPLLLSQKMSQFFFTRGDVSRLAEVVPACTYAFSQPPFKLLPSAIASRVSENPNIKIDEVIVPQSLRTLIPLALEWCITDEAEVHLYAKSVGKEKTKSFLQAFGKHIVEIEAFCFPDPLPIPVPDMLVCFQIAAKAFAVLKH